MNSVARLLGMPGVAYLGQPVLIAQHDGDFVEVEREQGLQLADARHPGEIVRRVAAHAAGRAGGRGQQPELLVVAERPFRHPGLGCGGADTEQPFAAAGLDHQPVH
jgi:hypothetical protein